MGQRAREKQIPASLYSGLFNDFETTSEKIEETNYVVKLKIHADVGISVARSPTRTRSTTAWSWSWSRAMSSSVMRSRSS